MNYYTLLRKELAAARKMMILNYGKPDHATYRTMCRIIEAEMRKAQAVVTASA